MKKKALLSSVLTIALCLSLIAGSTFALFTGKSEVNVAVTSGTVDVTATMKNLELYSPKVVGGGAVINATNVATENAFVNGGTAVIEGNTLKLDRVMPGDKVSFDLVIKNNSNVSVQYRTVIQKIADSGLWNGLNVTFNEEKFDGVLAKKSAWTLIEPDCNDVTVKVVIELPVTAGNEYQGKTCSLSYTVEAAQGNAEMPSEWDGNTENIEEDQPSQKEDGFYHITTAAEFINYINVVGGPNADTYTSVKAVLDKDIDLNGYEFVRSGDAYMFCGHFDGQNHTVSNYKITRTDNGFYTGLFGYLGESEGVAGCVENLTVKNATVTVTNPDNAGQTSAIVPSVNGASTVSNCHAINCTVSGVKKVAAVVGYACGQTPNGRSANVKNCSATNCTIYASDTRAEQVGAVLGYENRNCVVENLTHTGCNVYSGATPIANGVVQKGDVYEISNAEGMFWFADKVNNVNRRFFNEKTVKLVADIDLDNRAWTPVGQSGTQFSGRFDGNGYAIKNLSVTEAEGFADNDGVGLFGWVGEDGSAIGYVKNVKIVGASVTGHHYVGAIAGYLQFGEITGCSVENANITATCTSRDKNDSTEHARCGDKAGALIGMCTGHSGDYLKVTDCKAKDCTVKASRDSAQLIGYAYSVNTLENLSVDNVNVDSVNDACNHSRAGVTNCNVIVGNGTVDGLDID